MDKQEITYIAQKIETKEELLSLINRIKEEDMKEHGLGNKYYPFNIRHINYYCNPNNTKHRYTKFKIKKKSGGFRDITAPRNRSFMALLNYINIIFKAMYTPSPYAMGFTEGRSVIDNASKHKGMNYIFNTDLKDFFPSIEQARIWKRFQLKPLNLKENIASIIAGMCSMKVVEGDTTKFVLPQGAPTSPIITNMICDNLDRRLAGLAKRFGLNYSRYADDITFSSMHNVYQKDGDFIKEMERIITGQGFKMNLDKTRLQKKGSRQEVTGVIVSDKLNVTQDYVRDIRNILYIWDRYGYNTAYTKFCYHYIEEKSNIKKDKPDFIKVINGKLMYLKMVKGDEDSVYVRLYTKFLSLKESVNRNQKTTKHNITYIETTPLLSFEKNNSTKICITMSNKEGKASHRYAYFTIDNKKVMVSVNKDISIDEEQDKNKLSISNCLDATGKQFWLVHMSDKIIIQKKEPDIDIDKLNDDLDSLLNIENG